MSAISRPAMPARLASVAAALALLASLAVGFLPEPGGVRAMGPLPACRYDDILTTPRSYGDWGITLVDTILRVPRSYVPPDLVSTAQAGISGGGKVRAVMIDDLRALTEAAAAAGNGIGVESAYRSYESQESVFDSWVSQFGYARALEVSARPGHSEHQLGLAIDFRSEPGGSPFTGTWGTSPAGQWMMVHAWEHGFVMSYPKGAMALTCYSYEPWHFRYVGRPLAALIHASGLTPREYLWAHFTTTIVPPAPLPSRSPTKTAAPAASPAVTPSPTPSATPVPSPTMPPPTPTAEVTSTPVTPPSPVVTPPGQGQLLDGNAPDPSVLVVVGFAGVVALGAGFLRRRRAT